MRKMFFVFSIIVAILSMQTVLAEIPCSPECNIKGTILKVNFTEMYYRPCALTNCSGKVPDVECCPTDIMPTQPAGYFLRIKVTKVTSINEPCVESYSCSNLFSKDSEQIIFIPQEKGTDFTESSIIRGQVSAVWGKTFDSYEIENMPNSDTETAMYISIGLAIIILLIAILHFLRKNKK